MTSINRIAVFASSLGAGPARVLAVSVGVICMTHLARPLWAQPWDCATNSTICSTNSKVGIGTSTPTQPLVVNALGTSSGMILYSGGSSNYTFFGIGRTGIDAYIGMAGGAGNFSPAAAAGDLVIRSESKNILFSTDATGSTNQMYLKNGGNVGIGTTSPNKTLSVYGMLDVGAAPVSAPAATVGFVLNAVAGAPGTASQGILFGGNGVAHGTLAWLPNERQFIFRTSNYPTGTTDNYGAAGLSILGNVGIGTTAPQSKLAVNGTITTKEVVVTNTGWSDYVFKPNYHLTQLNEVAAYIKKHHHLPEIPSEAEVQEKGFKLGEIQVKLLAKVEELTLHVIHADERNNRLEQQNRDLQQGLARLEARIVDSRPKTDRQGGERVGH